MAAADDSTSLPLQTPSSRASNGQYWNTTPAGAGTITLEHGMSEGDLYTVLTKGFQPLTSPADVATQMINTMMGGHKLTDGQIRSVLQSVEGPGPGHRGLQAAENQVFFACPGPDSRVAEAYALSNAQNGGEFPHRIYQELHARFPDAKPVYDGARPVLVTFDTPKANVNEGIPDPAGLAPPLRKIAEQLYPNEAVSLNSTEGATVRSVTFANKGPDGKWTFKGAKPLPPEAALKEIQAQFLPQTNAPTENPARAPKHTLAETKVPAIDPPPPSKFAGNLSETTPATETPLTELTEGSVGLVRGASPLTVGIAALPAVTGGLVAGASALSQGKPTVDVLKATGYGAVDSAFGVTDARTALDSKQRPVDRWLAGGRAATASIATVGAAGSFTPAAPVAAPAAIISGVANLGLGVAQDGAYWTGLANNPGTLTQVTRALINFEQVCDANAHEMAASNGRLIQATQNKSLAADYETALASGNRETAEIARAEYTDHLLNLMIHGKIPRDTYEAVDRMARDAFTLSEKNNFQSAPDGAAPAGTVVATKVAPPTARAKPAMT